MGIANQPTPPPNVTPATNSWPYEGLINRWLPIKVRETPWEPRLSYYPKQNFFNVRMRWLTHKLVRNHQEKSKLQQLFWVSSIRRLSAKNQLNISVLHLLPLCCQPNSAIDISETWVREINCYQPQCSACWGSNHWLNGAGAWNNESTTSWAICTFHYHRDPCSSLL